MLNNKTTHNPNGNIVWSDSPNSIFKLAYLSKQDIKYYCFGDGGSGGGAGADFDWGGGGGIAGDIGAAEAGLDGLGPAAASASGDNTAYGEDNQFVNTTVELPLDVIDMEGFDPTSRAQGQETSDQFSPGFNWFGYNTGWGRGALADYTSTDTATAVADASNTATATSDVGSFDPMGLVTGLLGLALPGPLGALAKAGAYAANIGTSRQDAAAIGNIVGSINPFSSNEQFDNYDANRASMGYSSTTPTGRGTGVGTASANVNSTTNENINQNEFQYANEKPNRDIRGLSSLQTSSPASLVDVISPTTVNQPTSGISQSIRPPNRPLTVEEALRIARQGGGFNTRQAGGLVSLQEGGQPNPTYQAYQKWLAGIGGFKNLDKAGLAQGRIDMAYDEEGPIHFANPYSGRDSAGLYTGDNYNANSWAFPEHPDFRSTFDRVRSGSNIMFDTNTGRALPQQQQVILSSTDQFLKDRDTINSVRDQRELTNRPLQSVGLSSLATRGGPSNFFRPTDETIEEEDLTIDTSFAQSGGNIGGLMNTGPNVIDVINKGMAMPENIGAVQMQEKIDINQSTPYTGR